MTKLKCCLSFGQICGLVNKYFIIRRRKYIQTIIELLLPVILVALIVYGSRNEPTMVNPSYPVKPQPGDVIPLTFDSYVDFNGSNFKQLFLSPIYFIPNTSDTREIMDTVNQLIKSVDSKLTLTLRPEINQTTLNNRWLKMSPVQQQLSNGFISFKNVSGLTDVNGVFDIEIEQNGLKFPEVNHPWRSLSFSGPNYSRDYSNGFVQLQILVYQAYLSLRRAKLTKLPLENKSKLNTFTTKRLPYPEHRVVGWSGMLDQTPIIIAYGISITFTYFVFRTSNERANSSIEMLLMCGMNRKIYWFTNFLSTYIIMAFISTAQLVTIFTLTNLFSNSSFILVLIQIHIYIIHLILFGQLCTILFYRPIIVSVVSLIIFILSFAMIDTVLSNRHHQYLGNERRFTCFLPNSALVLLFRIIVQKEIRGFGLTWYNMNEPMAVLDHISSLEISILQVLWSFVYIVLIWYLDQVWPIQSGIPKVLYFPLLPWLRKKRSPDNSHTACSDERRNSQFFQSESPDTPKVIECIDVTKVYKSSITCPSIKFTAVDSLNLNVYSGSITCLLGHNGAGKTTTMNMITGMLLPNSGTININGINLLKETRRAREKMSLCPQHNSLYDDLTVGEHLYFYAIIKGASSETVGDEIETTLKNLSLQEHVNKLPAQLSGGMKRKLCLAIALIAGSTIIVLDEPSAGLDAESRREMWDTLKHIRSSRTILLTTHDMEEADALADRIIIMSRGRVICSGSPMYLKKLFSPGYILRILKSSTFNHSAVLSFITKLMPNAIIKLDTNKEIIFNLFENYNRSSITLSGFFSQLEESKAILGIESFGVSISTLEEVFSRAHSLDISGSTSDVNVLQDFTSQVSTVTSDDSFEVDGYNLQENLLAGIRLTLLQVYALLVKRFIDTRRNYLMAIFQLLIPPLIITCAFLLTNSNVSFPLLSKSQLLKPSLYPSSRVFLQSDTNDTTTKLFERQFEMQIKSHACEYDHIDGNANLTRYLVDQSQLVSPEKFLHQYIYGLSLKRDESNGIIYESWINFQAYHSMPIVLSIIAQIEDILTNQNNSISWITINLLPTHDIDQLKSLPKIEMIWIIIISFSLAFMSASYIFNPVDEVSSKFKLIQLMTGLHVIVYHLTSFIFDLCVHLFATGVIIASLYIFDTTSTITSSSFYNLSVIFIAFVLFGSIVIVINYLFSSIPSNPTQGYLIIFIVFCVTGAILSIIVSTLEIYARLNIITWTTFSILIKLFRVSPAFTISWLMKKLYSNGIQRNICSTIQPSLLSSACKKSIYSHCCSETCYDLTNDIDRCVYPNPYGWSGNRVNIELVVLASQLVFAVATLMMKEYYPRILASMKRDKLLPGKPAADESNLDQDVLNEKKYVHHLIKSDETSAETLVVSDLQKNYGKLAAVKGINFTVAKNECFGLLGVNGAGKSSTFAMLTGDINATSGRVYQGTIDAFKQLRLYQRNIGYCPQVNPILSRLTGREMLVLLARLRGVNKHFMNKLCGQLIKLANLDKISNKLSGTYSGGGKRKLSIALATVGQPKLIYLDEPTAGVDPNARKILWSTLMSIRDTFNTSMILTSHCMDECEALCSRLSIMMNGEFVCLGSPQHLKQKYGRGFTLNVRLNQRYSNQQDYVTLFTQKLKEKLQHVELIDKCDNNLTYLIGRSCGQWSYLFSTMEHMQELFHLEDYLLTDTTLGQIFMHFSQLRNISSNLIE